jgi:hypothetical protein
VRRSPTAGRAGQKIVGAAGRFRERFFAAVAVIADGAPRNEDTRRRFASAMARTSCSVTAMRLSSRTARRAAVHRPPISGSPARFTTASLRSIAATNLSGAVSA